MNVTDTPASFSTRAFCLRMIEYSDSASASFRPASRYLSMVLSKECVSSSIVVSKFSSNNIAFSVSLHPLCVGMCFLIFNLRQFLQPFHFLLSIGSVVQPIMPGSCDVYVESILICFMAVCSAIHYVVDFCGRSAGVVASLYLVGQNGRSSSARLCHCSMSLLSFSPSRNGTLMRFAYPFFGRCRQ